MLSFIFHAALLYAIRAIATETGEQRSAQNAVRNFVFMCMYFLLCLIPVLPVGALSDWSKYFGLPTVIFYIVCLVLNLVLIFGCYANICDESDIDMPLRRSRFEFVNKFREETARREQKAADESAQYIKERAEARALKRQNRKNKRQEKK